MIGTLPGSQDLLRAITEYDLVGVQTERDADNLRRGIIQETEAIQRTADVIVRGGRQTRVKGFPIAIDVSSFERAARR